MREADPADAVLVESSASAEDFFGQEIQASRSSRAKPSGAEMSVEIGRARKNAWMKSRFAVSRELSDASRRIQQFRVLFRRVRPRLSGLILSFFGRGVPE